nr:hypothetical protein [uncultured Blautia sp.]
MKMVLDEKRMEPSACHFYHFVITEYDRRGQMKKSMYLSEGKNISAFLQVKGSAIAQLSGVSPLNTGYYLTKNMEEITTL